MSGKKRRSFEEVIIDKVNLNDGYIQRRTHDLVRPGISEFELEHILERIEDAKQENALFDFVLQVMQTMQLDIDDSTFRKTIGIFYTDLVNKVMGKEEEHD